MKEVVVKVVNQDAMIKLGTLLTSYMYPNLVIAARGDLGACKTTFTKGIGLALGVKRTINSPTFTIMKVYYLCGKAMDSVSSLYAKCYRFGL